MKRSIVEMIGLFLIVVTIGYQIRSIESDIKDINEELELQDTALYLMYTDYQSQLDSLKKTVQWKK